VRVALLVAFWLMQVVAYAIFKYGSDHKPHFVLCFILGNVVGAASMWLSMRLFASHMNPNLVLVLTGGGAFLLTQMEMALLFGSRPSALQWAGIAAVMIGMAVATAGGPRQKMQHAGHAPLVERSQAGYNGDTHD
jgi:drug/metabolite transporter (DMT)-like permease